MTRENKLGLIIGFGIVLLVGVFISDHFSAGSNEQLAPLGQTSRSVTHATTPIDIVAMTAAPERDPLSDLTPRAQRQPQSADRAEAMRDDRPVIAITEPLTMGDPQAGLLIGPPTTGNQAGARPVRTTRATTPTTTITHTVSKNDTLYGIAQRYYGDGDRWGEIHRANNDRIPDEDCLPVGTVLRIPGVQAAPAQSPGTQPARPRTYRIKPGDVLSVVAQNLTGSARNTQRLFEANRNVIRDIDRLPVGIEIRIPPDLARAG
ncbi:MAG: LysM peptidoglycan-binding domain-containing protein [Phycisphaerales bacterium]|nr:LysM peptidoglycan-binding domain-containing protein [Phycisphaerales bacterium]